MLLCSSFHLMASSVLFFFQLFVCFVFEECSLILNWIEGSLMKTLHPKYWEVREKLCPALRDNFWLLGDVTKLAFVFVPVTSETTLEGTGTETSLLCVHQLNFLMTHITSSYLHQGVQALYNHCMWLSIFVGQRAADLCSSIIKRDGRRA